MATKRVLELDERVRQMIDDEFADYKRYLPTIQDKAQYQRKCKEYWDKITAKLKEGYTDVRAGDPTVGK